MRKPLLTIAIICVCIFALFAGLGIGVVATLLMFSDDSGFGDKIAVVNVIGPIIESDGVIRQLRELREREDVRAVVLRIDSPGGAVGASQEIFEILKTFAREKPVVASMGNVAASGGYYIALGAEEIVANRGTLTGSIGVRMEHVDLSELIKWAKIRSETLKSGEYKDIGSTDRPMTAAERKILEGLLAELHEQFKVAVSESRKIPIETVNEFADGRVFTGESALKMKLVDYLGGLDVAISEAQALSGMKGTPKVIYLSDDKSWWMELLSNRTSPLFEKVVGEWMGGMNPSRLPTGGYYWMN